MQNEWSFSAYGYAVGWVPERKMVAGMHRVILGFPNNEIDHINHDKLDNQRHNLRVVSHAANLCNQSKQRSHAGHPTHSQYKGVSWNARKQRWAAYIVPGGRQIHLGYFTRECDAAAAYDTAARHHFGEFASTNFGDAS